MAFMTTLGLILGGAGAVKQFIDGSNAKASGEKRLNELREPELTNLAKNLKPSFEQERQALARISQQEQTIAGVASGMDAASAMGLLSSGFTQTGQSKMDIYGTNLEKQFQADLLALEEDKTIRNMMEDRYQTEKASAEAEVMSGLQMQTGAITDIATGLISAGTAKQAAQAQRGIDDNDPPPFTPKEIRQNRRSNRQQRRFERNNLDGFVAGDFSKNRQKLRGAGKGFFNTDLGGVIKFLPEQLFKLVGGLFGGKG